MRIGRILACIAVLLGTACPQINSQNSQIVIVTSAMMLPPTNSSFTWTKQSKVTTEITSNRIMFSLSTYPGMANYPFHVQVYSGTSFPPNLVADFYLQQQVFWFIPGVPAGTRFTIVTSAQINNPPVDCSPMCVWQVNMQIIP